MGSNLTQSYIVVVLPVLVYACEVWTVYQRYAKKHRSQRRLELLSHGGKGICSRTKHGDDRFRTATANGHIYSPLSENFINFSVFSRL